jgi:hypothetical protein
MKYFKRRKKHSSRFHTYIRMTLRQNALQSPFYFSAPVKFRRLMPHHWCHSVKSTTNESALKCLLPMHRCCDLCCIVLNGCSRQAMLMLGERRAKSCPQVQSHSLHICRQAYNVVLNPHQIIHDSHKTKIFFYKYSISYAERAFLTLAHESAISRWSEKLTAMLHMRLL